MEIKAQLTSNKVRFDQEKDTHLVVSFTAPSIQEEVKRPPLCIVPLVDVSPSMMGAKLEYAKKSLIKLIEHMTPQDHCGLITFSSDAELVQRPVRCTKEAKDELKRKILGLDVGNATNIASALLMGFEVANKMDLAHEVITRVILFTDGEANRGPAVKTPDILALVKPNIGTASLSAFGYGLGANQELLLGLANGGNGNYAFISNPDDALSAFGKELGGLCSTYATNITVEVSPLAGHSITQVVTDVDADEEDMGDVTIKLPEILSEETRHLVLAIKLQAQKNAFPREVNVLDVTIGYDVMDANLKRERKTLEVKAKVQFVKSGEEQTKIDPELDQIVGIAQMVRAQLEADEHAKRGDYMRASSVMNTFSDSVKTRGLVGLSAVSSNLGNSLSSRDAYVGSASYRASVTRGATRGLGGTYSADAAVDLESLGVAMNNSFQTNVADAFSVDDVRTGDALPIQDVSTVGPTQIGGGQAGASWIVDPNNPFGQPSWPSNQAIWTGGNTGLNPIFIGGGAMHVAPATPPVVTVTTVPEAPVAEKKPKAKRKIKQKSKSW
jgi:Ca-activated chloride channel family protein